MSVSWLHVYILLIYVHIVHCKKYKTLLLPKPIQPIGSIIEDTPSNSIAFYYITFYSHSHDLGIPMDTTIWGNTPLLQPIWSEWLNYTRVCSELCTICISREISEKVTMLYAVIWHPAQPPAKTTLQPRWQFGFLSTGDATKYDKIMPKWLCTTASIHPPAMKTTKCWVWA